MSQAGYKYLKGYQLSIIICDLTVEFVKRWIPSYSRSRDQMEQAARSGKQNIAEGYLEKSLKLYIKLTGVAYASLGELLEDYEDYLRQHNLKIWEINDPRVQKLREFRVFWVTENSLNSPSLPNTPEEAANLLITLIRQAQFLLSRQITALEEKFIKEGGYSEKLFQKRLQEKAKS